MNRAVKVVLYVVLLAAAIVLAVKFMGAYRVVMRPLPERELIEGGEATHSEAPGVAAGTSNAPSPGTTNVPPTAAAGATNTLVSTNDLSAAKRLAESNRLAASKALVEKLLASTNAAGVGGGTREATFSVLMTYGVLLFVVVVCLSVLAAHDFSHVVAECFYRFILSDEGEAIKAPEYDHAEQVWTDGRHLEAIQLMREYLKRHPRKLYVALRIAEIYEKDLGNYLAAALEYEEVLRHRLRPEQWAWAAIHLANLYSGKLNQPGKALALLRRIDSEYGETTAAVKARSRLSQLEGESGATADTPVEIQEEPPPPSHLPKGFRPKQR